MFNIENLIFEINKLYTNLVNFLNIQCNIPYVIIKLTLISYIHYLLLLLNIYSSLIQLLIYCIPEIVQFSLLTEGSPLTVDDDLGVFSLVPGVFGYVTGLLHVACISARAQYETNVAVGIAPAKRHLCARCVVHQRHHINIAYLDTTEESTSIIWPKC